MKRSADGSAPGACWEEIDTGAAVWTVPAMRMKMRRVHRTPLRLRALAVLTRANLLTNNRFGLYRPVSYQSRRREVAILRENNPSV